MNCLKCGEKLPEGAKFCKSCGTIAGSKFQKVNSPLYRSETVIRQGPCKLIKKGGRLLQGKAMLTNHRFVFFKTGLTRNLQMIFMRNMVAGDVYIPLTDIRSVNKGVLRHGDQIQELVWGQTPTQEMDITITTKFEEAYSFVFERPVDWKNAIQRAVAAIKM